MNNSDDVVQAITDVVRTMMDKVMSRVLITDPFIAEKHHASKPLYAALVPDEIFKGSHFERRFVTPFGSVWEQLAVAVATACHGNCQRGYVIKGTIGEERLQRIQEVQNRLEHKVNGQGRIKPNWREEMKYVLNGKGEPLPVSVVCDIFIDSKINGERYAFELKGPLPNSDQTKVSKEKMMKLLAMNEHPVDKAFYALVYNPYGQRAEYAWSFPKRWFNLREDHCVLIGDDFWNFIGGDDTYQKFIREINALGTEYKERIYREFLNIEPPVGFDKDTLK